MRRRVLLLAALTALPAAPAAAGTYDVRTCDGRSGAAWVLTNDDPVKIEASAGCDAGLTVQERLGPGPVPGSESRAYFQLTAPPGTRIARLAYRRQLDKVNDDGAWRLELRDATGAALERCNTAPDCSLGGSGSALAVFATSTPALRFGIWCEPIAPSTGCDHGATLHRAHAILFAATTTIDDPVAPDGVTLDGVPGGWLRTGFSASVAARDNVGVTARTVQIDGQEAGRVDAVCDDSRTQPCALSGGASVPVALGTLPDGEHRIRAVAYDPGRLASASTEATLRVDRHAPDAPRIDLTGPRYASAATRTVTVTPLHDSASPPAAILTQVCARPSGPCEAVREQAASADAAAVDVGLPGDGEFDVRAWIRDAAGNADAAGAESTILGRDTVPPEVSLEISHTGDIPAGTAVTARYVARDPAPSSGTGPAGLEVSVDDAPFIADDSTLVAGAGHTYRVRATAVDAAGNRTTTDSFAFRGVAASAPAVAEPAATIAGGGAPVPLLGGQTAPLRRAPALRLTAVRRGPRATLAATLPSDATGRVTLRLRGTRRGRAWARSRTIALRRGRGRWTVSLPPHTTRLVASARYAGDARYLARARALTLK